MRRLTTQEVLERLRSAGVGVTQASDPLCLGKPVTVAPLPNDKTMSALVLDMRDPRPAASTSK